MIDMFPQGEVSAVMGGSKRRKVNSLSLLAELRQ
jgi:hypothetical protein